MIPKTIIHCLSGGLDSVTLLYDLHQQGHSVHCVLFDYKQQHVQELNFAKGHCHRLGVLFTTIELPPLGGLTDDNWVVPNRNAIFLSIACNVAIQAKADTVTIGCNKGDAEAFPDCSPKFIKAFNKTLVAAKIPVEVCAPYLDWPKWKIADLSKQLGVPPHEIWTCYRGGAKPCGTCPACLKLKEAIK